MGKTAQEIKDEAASISEAGVLSLDVAIALFSEKIGVAIELTVEKICMDLWTKLTKGNPVDTGLSRSRWIIREGEPGNPPVLYDEKGKPLLAPIPEPMPENGFNGDSIFFITNNVDYVPYLEAGSSQQAPNGWIRISIATVEAEIETILEQVKEEIN